MRILTALFLAGCSFHPTLDDGRVACGSGGECPPGFHCFDDGRCHRLAPDLSQALPDFSQAPSELPDLANEPDQAVADLAETPPCGERGQPCCAGTRCGHGGCCSNGSCVGSGEPLGPALVCLAGASEACGTAGGYCCADQLCGGNGCCSGNRCVAPGALCPTGGTCDQGSCGSCGGGGKPCCGAGFCTTKSVVCAPDDKCQPCGGKDQACCDGNRCNSGGCCDAAKARCVAGSSTCADGSKCVSGGCSSGTCGGAGQAICGGGIGCTAPFTIPGSNGECVVCGGSGQPCCAKNWCAAPYACNGLCQ